MPPRTIKILGEGRPRVKPTRQVIIWIVHLKNACFWETWPPPHNQIYSQIWPSPPHWIWSIEILFQNLQILHHILLNFCKGGAFFEKHADPEKKNRNSRKSRANRRILLEPFLRSRKEENLYGHWAVNNARRILSKGSTLLRWVWVFLERTRILSGIQSTTYFIEIFVVETKRFVGSFVHVILTRQTCSQRSSRAAKANAER